LAQLEQSEEDAMRETLQLTQKDYEKHIERLHEELIKAWENEERVKSLKIAIQVLTSFFFLLQQLEFQLHENSAIS
jgi:DNA-binding XRE family transcriptional regulator